MTLVEHEKLAALQALRQVVRNLVPQLSERPGNKPGLMVDQDD